MINASRLIDQTMDFTEACQTLRMWIDESDGQPITLPSGNQSCFFSLETFEQADLQRYEIDFGTKLPEPLHFLMLTVGAAILFDSDSDPPTRIEIHQLDEIRLKYPAWMENPQDLFTRFLPIAADQGLAEVGMFLLKCPEPYNFMVVNQKQSPEGWEDMVKQSPGITTTLESWIIEMVQTEGRMQPHQG